MTNRRNQFATTAPAFCSSFPPLLLRYLMNKTNCIVALIYFEVKQSKIMLQVEYLISTNLRGERSSFMNEGMEHGMQYPSCFQEHVASELIGVKNFTLPRLLLRTRGHCYFVPEMALSGCDTTAKYLHNGSVQIAATL